TDPEAFGSAPSQVAAPPADFHAAEARGRARNAQDGPLKPPRTCFARRRPCGACAPGLHLSPLSGLLCPKRGHRGKARATYSNISHFEPRKLACAVRSKDHRLSNPVLRSVWSCRAPAVAANGRRTLREKFRDSVRRFREFCSRFFRFCGIRCDVAPARNT